MSVGNEIGKQEGFYTYETLVIRFLLREIEDEKKNCQTLVVLCYLLFIFFFFLNFRSAHEITF